MRPSKQLIGFRYRLAKLGLSGSLRRVLRTMKGGEWGSAANALKAVLEGLDVTERPGEIGTVRTINADWYYALGPRQRTRAARIVSDVGRLFRGTTDDSVAERMVPQMEALIKEVTWLEKLIRDPGEGISHGPFKIVTMAGVRQADMADVLKALDQATKVLQAKFPKLLYGDVYVAKTLNQGFGAVARYMPSSDVVILSLKAKGSVGDIHAICHEFGHRYDRKFWKDKASRSKFGELSSNPEYETIRYDAKLRKNMADEYIEALHAKMAGRSKAYSSLLMAWIGHLMKKSMLKLRDLSQQALRGSDKAESALQKLIEGKGAPVDVATDKEVRGRLSVTPYGAKNVSENFAEAFAYYVLGKPLPAEIAEIMDKLR